jgi:hypothetical protein
VNREPAKKSRWKKRDQRKKKHDRSATCFVLKKLAACIQPSRLSSSCILLLLLAFSLGAGCTHGSTPYFASKGGIK